MLATPSSPSAIDADQADADRADGLAFRALLERAERDVVLVIDHRLRIRRAGVGAAELARRSTSELVGLSLIAAFGSAELDGVARQAVEGGTRTVGEAEIGHPRRSSFQIEVVPVDGVGFVVYLHDVTALRRGERIRRDFVANISHELRSPLTSVKLLAETLAAGVADDPDSARDFAGQIQREVDHLAQLVDELFDLSLIESGHSELRVEPVDPGPLLRTVAQRISPMAERRSIRVRVVAPDELEVVAAADAARLSQALLNLSHNAVKFSRPNGEVRLGCEVRGQMVRFTVADDGIGVPEEHQARIFERFYKVDRSRARGDDDERMGASSGLGLAIVRHIAEAHGGAVGLWSEEGTGSTFWIDIPRVTGDAASAAEWKG